MTSALIQSASIALIVAGAFVFVIALLVMMNNDEDPPENQI